eukprot:g3698.t1
MKASGDAHSRGQTDEIELESELDSLASEEEEISCRKKGLACVVASLSLYFERHARFIYRHAVATILITLVLAISLISCMALIVINADGEYLFSPQGSIAHKDADEFQHFFPSIPLLEHRYGVIISHPTRDLLKDRTAIEVLKMLDDFVMGERKFGETDTNRCVRSTITGNCLMQSVLTSTNMDVDAFLAKKHYLCYPNFENKIVGVLDKTDASAGGSELAPAGPGECPYPNASKLVRASALKQVYYATNATDKTEWKNYKRELLWLRDQAWPVLKGKLLQQDPEYQMHVWNYIAVNLEFNESNYGDIPLFFAAITLLFLFCVSTFYRVGFSFISALDVLGGIFAITMTIGLCALIKVDFNPVVSFFPFLLLGTSVDDTFIMLHALSRIPVPDRHPEDRIALMLKKAGPSMFMTSLTDIIAFGLGIVTTSFPAARVFCIYAMIANIMDFALQVSWCVAWASLDARRLYLNVAPDAYCPRRVGCSNCCCFRLVRLAKEKAACEDIEVDDEAREPLLRDYDEDGGEQPGPAQTSSAAAAPRSMQHNGVDDHPATDNTPAPTASWETDRKDKAAAGSVDQNGLTDWEAEEKRRERRRRRQVKKELEEDSFLADDYEPSLFLRLFEQMLRPTWVRVMVMFLWVGIMAVGIWACLTKIEIGLARVKLVPMNSYMIPYFDAELEYFSVGSAEAPIDLLLSRPYHSDKPWRYWDPDVRKKLKAALLQFAAPERTNMNPDTLSWWLDDMEQWLLKDNKTIAEDELGFLIQVESFVRARPSVRSQLSLSWEEGPDAQPILIPPPPPPDYSADDKSIKTPPPPSLPAPPISFDPSQGIPIPHIIATLATISSRYATEDPMDRIAVYSDLVEAQKAAEKDGVKIGVTSYQTWLKCSRADYVILWQVFWSFATAIGGVMAVVAVFIPDFFVASLTGLAVIAVDTCVVGYMSLWKQSINTVSMISLIMSVGFSVDLIAHVCLAFVNIPPDAANNRLDKTLLALREVGTPVFQAVTSTIVGVIPTAFSQSNIFFNFFSITFLVLIFGLAHGLIFMPTFLSFFGPIYRTPSKPSRDLEQSAPPRKATQDGDASKELGKR